MTVATAQNGRLFTIAFAGPVLRGAIDASGNVTVTNAENLALIAQEHVTAATVPTALYRLSGNVRVVGVSCAMHLCQPVQIAGLHWSIQQLGAISVNLYNIIDGSAQATGAAVLPVNQPLIATVGPTGVFHPLDWLLAPSGNGSAGNADPLSNLAAFAVYRANNIVADAALGVGPASTFYAGHISLTVSCIRE